jgi:uncharacterized protein YndB with AHSA1/START domain
VTDAQSPVVRVTHRFRAPAERVFDAWLDPAMARRFLFATPTGTVVRADIDARVGGSWSIVDRRDGEDVEHTGEYLEIDRPRRLVFTFGVPKYAPWFDRVEVDVTPVEGGGCELTLTHTMVPQAAEWADGAAEGWAGILRGLAAALGEEG